MKLSLVTIPYDNSTGSKFKVKCMDCNEGAWFYSSDDYDWNLKRYNINHFTRCYGKFELAIRLSE